MRIFLKQKRAKQKKIDEKVTEINSVFQDYVIAGDFEKDIEKVKELFKDVDILRVKYVDNNYDKERKYCIIFSDGMVNNLIINENIVKPLMLSTVEAKSPDLVDTVMNEVIQINEMKKTIKIKDIVEGITYGDAIVFIKGAPEVVILNTKGFQTRSIMEPDNEKNLSGPREGFTEAILLNLSLVRRKVRTPDLKMKFITLGRRTQTKACVCYMDGIVDPKILAELYRRLDKIDIDAVLDTNYITELIKDARWSPFRTTGYTERPDVVAGKIMEGRIAIFLDGTPDVLTVPYLFIENFQSGEDYYLNFFYSSFARIIRIFGFFLTVTVPGFYIAIVAFHQEMMPLQLFLNIAAERQSVPLPAALECFIMLIVFDILKETGVRMPSNVGQALSIVGAIVIGQAGVEAKLVAAPMIIVVGLTGITSLLVPKMNAPVIYIRFAFLLLSSCFGFYGFFLTFAVLVIHLINIRSLGIPQVSPSGKLKFQENKDILFRAPWWKMIIRPSFAMNKVRMSDNSHD